MSTISSIYPRVEISTTTIAKSRTETVNEEIVSGFFPFFAEKGSTTDVEVINSTSEFESVYGTPMYTYTDTTNDTVTQWSVVNAIKWLSNGGTAYCIRLEAGGAIASSYSGDIVVESRTDDTSPSFKVTATAASSGTWGDALSIKIQPLATSGIFNGLFNITVGDDYYAASKSIDDIPSHIDAYCDDLANLTIDDTNMYTKDDDDNKIGIYTSGTTVTSFPAYTVTLNGGSNGSCSSGTLTTFMTEDAWEADNNETNDDGNPVDKSDDEYYKTLAEIISDKNMYNFDVILDPWGNESVYTSNDPRASSSSYLQNIISDNEETYFVLDWFSDATPSSTYENSAGAYRNLSFGFQTFDVYDSYLEKNVKVGLSYFLASLIPYNDVTYGIQYPIAGYSRGKLNDVTYVSENPNALMQSYYYDAKLNYAIKEPSGTHIMSQNTYYATYSAMQFINNSRVVSKLIKEIRSIGKTYLFEFNDSTTLNAMRTEMTKYMESWVTARVLSNAEVSVEAGTFSDETVDVTMSITFTGTIEIILVDITIS